MSKHRDDEPFIHASQILRRANYRGGSTREGVIAGGPRVGLPPEHVAEVDDLETFEMTMVEDPSPDEPLGAMSALGRHLLSTDQVTMREIYAEGSEGDDDNIAQQDFADDEGTPGRGRPLDNRYEYESEVGVQSREGQRQRRSSLPLLRRERTYYAERAEQATLMAQRAEDAGREVAARHFDAMASKFLSQAQAAEQKIALQLDHEARGNRSWR